MATIEEARKLYENGKTADAMKICVKLVNEGNNKKEALFLLSIMCVNGLGPKNEKYEELFYKYLFMLGKTASSLEEVFDIEAQIRTLINKQIIKIMNESVNILIEKPTMDNYKECILDAVNHTCVICAGASEWIRLSKIKDENGNAKMSNKEANELFKNSSYYEEYAKINIYEEIARRSIDAAQQIFDNTKALYKNNDYCSVEFAIKLAEEILNRGEVARYLVHSMGIEKHKELYLESMMLKATILDWELNLVLHYQGISFSLHQSSNNRYKYMGELSYTYEKIKTINPNFIQPQMPPADSIKIIPTQGCYVATAVYGSYDCPQVWTLRRYRDYTLAETWYGRAFIHTYYAISPTLVKWFGHTEWFKKMWQGKLDKMVSKLQAKGVEATPYEDRKW